MALSLAQQLDRSTGTSYDETKPRRSGEARSPAAREAQKPSVPRKPTPAPKPAPAPTYRAPSSGGGGGGSFGASAPAPAPAVDHAAVAAAEAAAARERQLEALRKQISAQPLDPALVAAFAERERLAARGVSQAEAFGQRGREQSQIDFDQFLAQLGQQTDQAIGGLRSEAAARNLAFQPAFVGVGMRDIRDEATEAQGLAQQQRAQFLSGLDRQIAEAEQAKAAEVAAIARERARAQADHQSFIDAQLAALR